MERKLSTILAADVVGFSKIMAADEEGTLEILKNRRFVIDNSIKEQGGKYLVAQETVLSLSLIVR